MAEKKLKKLFAYWQIPLAVVFLCFGFLLAAQYRTHVAYSNSLETQSYSNLSTIALRLMDGSGQLQTEINDLQHELEDIQAARDSGMVMTTDMETRINTLQTAIGVYPVSGPGVSVTITSESSQLMAYDLIDITNELFASGAEAVSINNQRVTGRTQIADVDGGYGNFSIMVDGQTLLFPVVIRAIGNSATLETSLVYPGGIIDTLRIFIYPIVRQEEELNIPAAVLNSFNYSVIPPPAT